jgi:hypothetical protein
MKRRGVIQGIYKEVMTIPKEEKGHLLEANISVDTLFDTSTNDTSPEQNEPTANDPIIEDTPSL